MAVAFDWLNDANLVISNVTETIYSNPASTITLIPSIFLHNTHSSAVTVTLYCVPDNAGVAGTAAAGNQFFSESLAAGKEYVINDHTFILRDTADTIQAVAGTDAKVTIFMSGLKLT